jgi:hypothetical protein
MVALDGNAAGGLLNEVFGGEMTTAVGTCATCGSVGPVAETVVYLDAPGTVIRCRVCTSVLMVIVRRRGVNCVGMLGLGAIDPAARS